MGALYGLCNRKWQPPFMPFARTGNVPVQTTMTTDLDRHKSRSSEEFVNTNKVRSMESEENSAKLMSLVPDELLLAILTLVEWKDLCRIACVCKRLKYLCQSDVLWRQLCRVYWLDVIPDDSTTWYQTFIKCYKKWGRFISCYSTVKELWNQIETALEERGASDIIESLNGPRVADDEKQDAPFMELVDIPQDLLCSFHIRDGQKLESNLPFATTGLGGFLNVYDYEYCPEFLNYDLMVTANLDKNVKRRAGEGDLDTLTFLVCSMSYTTLHICLNSAGDFKRGNIVYCPHSCCNQTVFQRTDARGFYLCAESFTDWLRQLADRLRDPETMVDKSSILRFDHKPDCVAVTRHVKVSVATAFIPELHTDVLSKPSRMVFAYRIIMEMDKNAPSSGSCQLLTRHWVITDANGKVERVNGDGVIGAFPVIKPGTAYSWSSFTAFSTTTGSMGGHFGMVNLQTGEKFNVKCPDFHMKALPYLLLPETTAGGDT